MTGARCLLALASLGPAWCMAQPPGASSGSQARIQVWVETQPDGAGPTLLLPYVKSLQTMQLHYSLDVARKGVGGNSHVSQQGTINALANEATLLGRVTIGLKPQGDCRIELVLDDAVSLAQIGRYSFDCE
jgi:Thin aggregative fimbriae synthesis protein